MRCHRCGGVLTYDGEIISCLMCSREFILVQLISDADREKLSGHGHGYIDSESKPLFSPFGKEKGQPFLPYSREKSLAGFH